MEYTIIKSDLSHILTIDEESYNKLLKALPGIKNITTNDNTIVLPSYAYNNNLRITKCMFYFIWSMGELTTDCLELSYKLGGPIDHLSFVIMREYLKLMWSYVNRRVDCVDELQRLNFIHHQIENLLNTKYFTWKTQLHMNKLVNSVDLCENPNSLQDNITLKSGNKLVKRQDNVIYKCIGSPSYTESLSITRIHNPNASVPSTFYPCIQTHGLPYEISGFKDGYMYVNSHTLPKYYKRLHAEFMDNVQNISISELLLNITEDMVDIMATGKFTTLKD